VRLVCVRSTKPLSPRASGVTIVVGGGTLRAKAFVPNPAGVKYPGDFLFLVHRGEMIFL